MFDEQLGIDLDFDLSDLDLIDSFATDESDDDLDIESQLAAEDDATAVADEPVLEGDLYDDVEGADDLALDLNVGASDLPVPRARAYDYNDFYTDELDVHDDGGDLADIMNAA